MLSTRIRNASTSMSKRAPSGEQLPVRRAVLPSTASRMSATAVSVTNSTTGVDRWNESAVRAVTPPTRVALVSVTRFAGPSASAPERYRPRVSAAAVKTP